MKKFIFPIALGLVLVACKKDAENEKVSTTENKEQTAENQIKTQLKELPKAKVTELLQSKNDTLYVTNFFATWCGPCIREIPHFQEVMEETKGQPVKFTFINLDEKTDWETEVKPFVEKHKIQNNTILLNGKDLDADFFSTNFKTWAGDFIPFTFIRKGEKTEEIGGGVSKEILVSKMKTLQ